MSLQFGDWRTLRSGNLREKMGKQMVRKEEKVESDLQYSVVVVRVRYGTTWATEKEGGCMISGLRDEDTEEVTCEDLCSS